MPRLGKQFGNKGGFRMKKKAIKYIICEYTLDAKDGCSATQDVECDGKCIAKLENDDTKNR